MGFKTIAISTSASKKDISLKLGADIFIDESSQDASAELQKLGGVDVIVTTAPKAEAVVKMIGGLGFEGKLLVLSLPLDTATFAPGEWSACQSRECSSTVAW
jgi:D-arabinose 1-dehydrogenase-like Zn-dependent alcohol dehydrogenase